MDESMTGLYYTILYPLVVYSGTLPETGTQRQLDLQDWREGLEGAQTRQFSSHSEEHSDMPLVSAARKDRSGMRENTCGAQPLNARNKP